MTSSLDRRRNPRDRLTLEARRALSSVEGYAELFDAVHSCCRQIAGEDFLECAVGLIDPENGEYLFPLRGHLPMRPPMRQAVRGELDMLTRGLNASEPLVFVDRVYETGATNKTPAETGRLPPWVTLPVRRRRDTIGVLAVRVQPWETHGPPPFMSELQELAEDVAWAAEVCHRQEQRAQDLNDLQDIFRISTILQAIRDPEELLHEVCDVMTRSFGFDRASLYLADDEGKAESWPLVACSGRQSQSVAPVEAFVLEGMVVDCLRDGRVRRIRSPRHDPGAPACLQDSLDAHQVALLPLVAKGRALGLICADHRYDRGQLNERRLSILRLFANQVAMAIENLRLYARVEAMAWTDSLTGLRNRHFFDQALEREVARVRRYGHDLCLMMADLRDFKRLNDTHGHLEGDEALRRVARLLEQAVRGSDTVCRFGGDEFVILMPDTDLERARRVRRRLEDLARESCDLVMADGHRVELSLGLRAADPAAPENVLVDADLAMYEDKASQERRGVIRAFSGGALGEIERAEPFVANVLRVLCEKEPFYLDHSRRVMAACEGIGTAMGFDSRQQETLCLGALLHDLGKVALDGELLQRASALTPVEYQIIQSHASLGADLIGNVGYLAPACPILRHHHERFDGRRTGRYPAYPDGLVGEAIPLGARIVKVADCFDFMVFERPYHVPVSAEEASRILRDGAGRDFDPVVVDAFLSIMREGAEWMPGAATGASAGVERRDAASRGRRRGDAFGETT